MEWKTILDLGYVAVAIVLAVIWLKSSSRKQADAEREKLVAFRGELIEEMEKKIEELENRVQALEAEVSSLYKLKAEEIATLVVEKIGGRRLM